MGIGRIFDLSRRSLGTFQRAMDITAHNVANASNPDYSRQQVNLKTSKSEIAGGYIWGTGVTIDNISRVRNSLVDAQLRSNYQKQSNNSKKSDLLSQIETQFSEPSELGLANLTTSFFNSWSDLSVTPNSMPLRYNVIRSAEKLSAKIQGIYEGLALTQQDILNETKSKVQLLNNKLQQVQSLNAQIFEQQSVGYYPNDLLDVRDRTIDELSKMANINVTYDESNSAIISIGGAFAVDRSNAVEFKLNETNGKLTVQSINGDITATINDGEIAALTHTYSYAIPQYKDQLNTFISSLVNEVNTIHRTGSTLDTPPQTGFDFFESFSEGELKINRLITDDPKKLAISSNGDAGNGDVATKLAELANQKKINGTTFLDFYSSLISLIGNDKLIAEQTTESNDLVIQQLEEQKASISGVSVDEEMTNIIKFQRAYDASAKLIKVADEMLQTVLNMV